jgi:hypothetical protein
MVSPREATLVAKHMLRTGQLPLPGGQGVREHGLAALCRQSGTTPSLARRAFAMVRLLGGPAGDDVRHRKVDDLWTAEVNRWFDLNPDIQLPLPQPGNLPHGSLRLAALLRARVWVMLAAEHQVAGVADAVQFSNAVLRLCPDMPAQPVGMAAANWLNAKAAVAARLAPDAPMYCPAPWPADPNLHERWELPPLATPAQYIKVYLKELSSDYERSREWLGATFVADLGHWYTAVLANGAQQAAARTLACIGGERELDWRWPTESFVDAAQTWCLRQMFSTTGALRTVFSNRLLDLEHASLVLHGMAWLAGIHPDPGALLPPDVAQADVDEARTGDWLARAVNRANRKVRTRQRSDIVSPLTVYRYQPHGQAKLSVSEDQMAAARAMMLAKGGRDKLRALMYLRWLHVHLGYVPPIARNVAGQDGLYNPPLRALVQDQGADHVSQFCGLRRETASLCAALEGLWLFGGEQVQYPDDTTLPSCFQVHNLSALPPAAEVDRLFGDDFGAVSVQASVMLAMDTLTNPFRAAQGQHFRRGQYKYLAGSLDSRESTHKATPDPWFDDVRRANQRLFGELAQDNLRARLKETLGGLRQPAPGPALAAPPNCPLCNP